MGALLLLFFLVSCATTSYYFDADAKTPPESLAKLVVGYGVTISSINGKTVKFGPGPVIVTVKAGPLALETTADYFFEGRSVSRAVPSGSYDVLGLGASSATIEPLPQETWFVGEEFSRSILEKPVTIKILPPNSTESLDTNSSQARLIAKKVNWLSPQITDPVPSGAFFIGQMVPFFSSDSTLLLRSRGGVLQIVTLVDPTKVKEIKLTDADLVWGGTRPDGLWWILDLLGNQFLVDPQKLSIVRTVPGKGHLENVLTAQGTNEALFVQTGPSEIKRVDPSSLEAAPFVKTDVPVIDWAAAAEKESLAVLTGQDLTLYDAPGKELAKRSVGKLDPLMDWTFVRSLALSPNGVTLAFRDGSRNLWCLPTDKLSSFPQDQWKVLGHSGSLLVPVQLVRWLPSGDRMAVFDAGIDGNDFTALVFDTAGATTSPLALGGGSYGEILKMAGSNGQSTAVLLGANLSPDGKKVAFVLTGAVRAFYGVVVLDSSRVKPKKVS